MFISPSNSTTHQTLLALVAFSSLFPPFFFLFSNRADSACSCCWELVRDGDSSTGGASLDGLGGDSRLPLRTNGGDIPFRRIPFRPVPFRPFPFRRLPVSPLNFKECFIRPVPFRPIPDKC